MTTWAVRVAWLITAALALVGFALIVAARRDLASPGGDFIFNPLGGLRQRVVRVPLIVARARSVIGWTLWLSGLFISLQTFSSVHPVVGLETHPSSLTAPKLVSTLQPTSMLVFVALALIARDRTIPALRSSATAVPVIP